MTLPFFIIADSSVARIFQRVGLTIVSGMEGAQQYKQGAQAPKGGNLST